MAGGLLLYEVGTADVGLASAGYNARAQDASTVFTNPAGMTKLGGTQVLAAGQVLWGNNKFSIGSGTSTELGDEDGGYAIGSDGWLPGGGAFLSYSLSPRLNLGFALTGNFGAAVKYDDDWVGRYYVKETTLLGISFLPSIAYKVTDKISLGASLNAMYGTYKNKVAINNVNPAYGDGQLKLDDNDWGWGVNLGLLYEFSADTRLGLTWNSEVDLDFKAEADFSNLAPGLSALLNSRGLLDSSIEVGITVPQQVMASIFHQLTPQWAVLGSVGWQDWSKFGQVELGIDDVNNPTSTTTDLDFKDTWHGAVGAQYRINDPWVLNFGIAYDSEFQDNSKVSPLAPLNSAWRFGVGAQQQVSETFYWGVSAEYLYGGTLDTSLQGNRPVALGGRGDVDGSYDDTGAIIVGLYGSWKF
jgi:long-chain fatty acid transport protein